MIVIIIISSRTGTATYLRTNMPFNRHDITFINKKTKNSFLIDIALPNTHNLAKTITDNKTNTKNWRMKYVLCGSKTQLK